MNDYYPFGMAMPGRSYAAGDEYRYGYNGKEKDKDMNSLTAYDYGFRIYNPAIAKFLSVDPLMKGFPMLTPYQYASNRPIDGIDMDGLEFLQTGTALYRFTGHISSTYEFNFEDVYITDMNKHNLIMGIAPELEAGTNPSEKDSKVNWEEQNIPKANNSALFKEWITEMRNFNKQQVSTNGNATYASPSIDANGVQVSKGATLLSAVLEVWNIWDMIQKSKFAETYKNQIADIHNSASAFDMATNLVSRAIKGGILPDVILNSQIAKDDLVNFMIDGKTSDDNIMSGYNEVISIWGRLLIDKQNAVLNGTLFKPVEIKISDGGKAPDLDKLRVRKTFIIPAQVLDSDVQTALDRTNNINFVAPITKVKSQ